jgi:hypothetical protein
VHRRGVGQAEEHAGFATNSFQILEEFLFDVALRLSPDAVDQVDELVDELIGQLAAPDLAKSGEQEHPQQRRMPMEFAGFFHGYTLGVGTQHMEGKVLEEIPWELQRLHTLQLGDLMEEIFQGCPTGIGAEIMHHGLVCFRQRGRAGCKRFDKC